MKSGDFREDLKHWGSPPEPTRRRSWAALQPTLFKPFEHLWSLKDLGAKLGANDRSSQATPGDKPAGICAAIPPIGRHQATHSDARMVPAKQRLGFLD